MVARKSDKAAKKSAANGAKTDIPKVATKTAGTLSASEPMFPAGVAQPAVRALASIGVTKVEQLSKHRESDVAALHGMGPKALGILKTALKTQGKSFKA